MTAVMLPPRKLTIEQRDFTLSETARERTEAAETVCFTGAVPESLYWFRGHFPGRPILPGVLMIEAVAQTAAVMMAAASSP